MSRAPRRSRRRLPDNPTCADLVEFGGSLTLTCQGCRNQRVFTALQAVLKFGEQADEEAVRHRLKCEKCGRRGRTDAGWFRASFGFPFEAWMSAEQLASMEAAAKFDQEQRSQFAATPSTTPKARRRR